MREKKLGELRRKGKKAPPRAAARPEVEVPKEMEKAELEPAEEAEVVEEPVVSDDEITDHAEADKKMDARRDMARRRKAVANYRAPDRTKRYAEHNYWHRTINQQGPDMIRVNAFWRDFAGSSADEPFLPTHFAEASGSFAEMLLALAVLDLPFKPGKHTVETEGKRVSMKAATPLLLVRKEIKKARSGGEPSQILVSQAFFRLDDRYRFEGNERREKYVTGEFLAGIPYGCRVVLTNPSSAPRKLDLLLQVPEGAIPVQRGFETRGVPQKIDAYGTTTFEYAFYFPQAGDYAHYPVQADHDGLLLASAQPFSFKVVKEPSEVDTGSWGHISQSGSEQQVLAYLEDRNLLRLDLKKIAWRLRDRAFFGKLLSYLRTRHAYDHLLWSYSVLHRDPVAAREYLSNASGFLSRCGKYLESALVHKDPVERLSYQHIEYAPLFNGRAHQFGRQREILNADLARQYGSLLRILAYRTGLDDQDWMSVSYYLLLQDRVEEALETFSKVDPKRLPMALQYDYMRAYLDFFTDDHALARRVAEQYADHPVKRWRSLFQDVLNQLDEAAGKPMATSDAEDRTQKQTELAAQEPSLELEVEARRVTVSYRNVDRCEVCYYEMDIEFLFSSSPFVQRGSGAMSYVRPNRKASLTLPAGKASIGFDLPEEYTNSNLMVEVRGGGVVKRQTYYANSLSIGMMQNYGQLKVAHAGTGKPLPKVYVKVFARKANGKVRFHKDGYTDLRGRFDYASLSGSGSRDAARYAILIMSASDGAVIREVAPPVE